MIPLRVLPTLPTLRTLGPWTLIAAVCAATAALVWQGYVATEQSKRSVRLLLEGRAAEQLALVRAGVVQDMRGAHASVLVPLTHGQLVLEPPYDLAEAFARGFARFPYPESFFVWKNTGGADGLAYLFNRVDRRPPWHEATRLPGPYPVDVVREPPAIRALVNEARRQADYDHPFATFETDFAGVPYQVVVNLLYRGDDEQTLFGLVGFTVNLAWVRQVYFQELIPEIARVIGDPHEMSFTIFDESRQVVTSTQREDPNIPSTERSFPLIFVDRTLIDNLQAERLPIRTWTVRAATARQSQLAAVTVSTNVTFALISLAATAALIGLFVTARGIRMAAKLATLKSDFVSSVTHELKTPLSAIRLVADTLVHERYDSLESIRDYAGILAQGTRNMTRLIENLLTYSRLSDVGHAFAFERTDLSELVEDALTHFHPLLTEHHFTVDLELSPDLPEVLADRASLLQAIDNLIDNAIKYSCERRVLRIQARAVDSVVTLVVSDRGTGIRSEELDRVCEKFFRGQGVKSSGSGLGLAIVRHVVEAHGGRLTINSVLGMGTQVELSLKTARAS
jgi:signal transduction histidine kinase